MIQDVAVNLNLVSASDAAPCGSSRSDWPYSYECTYSMIHIAGSHHSEEADRKECVLAIAVSTPMRCTT